MISSDLATPAMHMVGAFKPHRLPLVSSFAPLHVLFESSSFVKILYLACTSFILHIDCTFVFYMTRRAKLDPSCMYFEDIFMYINLCINLSFYIIEEIATMYIYKLLPYNRFYFCLATLILHTIQISWYLYINTLYMYIVIWSLFR